MPKIYNSKLYVLFFWTFLFSPILLGVPVLPESGYKFTFDPSKTLNLTIAGNKITIHGEVVEVDEIASVLENEADEQDIVITRIDRAQSMSLVRDVQEEFRKADRLKFLYVGQTPMGEQVEVPLLNEYLVNLFYIQEGFRQIYGERAQEMYGKSFLEISNNRSANEEYKEMYDAVRQGVPMALSIAED